MVGQGSPHKAPKPHATSWLVGWIRRTILSSLPLRRLRIAIVACALCVIGSTVTGAELDIRLRITWGEATQRHWNGLIQLSEGGFSEVRHLGFEANAPTSVVNRGNALIVWQPSPVVFDGIDVHVTAPESATLTIVMQPDRNANEEEEVTFALSDFVSDMKHTATGLIDSRNNRVAVRRAPGDHLRINSTRDSYVFSPGEDWAFNVEPKDLPPNAELKCLLRLVNTRSEDEVWSEDFDVDTDANGNTTSDNPYSIKLPATEGPYDLIATLRERKITAPVLVQSFRERRFSPPVVYERKVQLVVIGPNPAPIDTTEWKEVDAIGPDKKTLWDRLTELPKIEFPKNPLKRQNETPTSLNNDLTSLRDHLGQELIDLAPNGWHAVQLPVGQAGLPHLLEVEYPNDTPQTLAISVIEPNAAGMVTPLALDSGVDVVKSPAPATPGIEKHRLIFWPKTDTPWLLLSNRRNGKPATFGKIRVLAGPKRLPSLNIEQSPGEARLLAAYYDKPLFPENFSAAEALDETSQQSLGDWNTFYLGGVRLAQYLKHVGYNSAIISVSRDGATIYPSRLMDSTPRYDSGALFVSGQDPRQKDILEMLFRIFDREQLKLIPAFHFATPLPELDAMRRRGGPAANGIELLGFDGQSWPTRIGTNRGQAPYYNPLDTRVQSAVRHVIGEVVDRYSHHRSFAGISLQLGPDTFVQMPGTTWGNDDRTVARFKAETQSNVPGSGPNRFRDRADYLSVEGRDAWLNWRAEKLTEFYAQIQRDVARARPDAQLYLATSGLLASSAVRDEMQPRLPLRSDMANAMLQLGLDPKRLQEHAAIVPLRPQRTRPLTSLADQAVDLQLRNSESVDSLFDAESMSGVLDYHQPLTFALPSFNKVSPFGADKTRTWSAAHIPSNGFHARAQFIQTLAALDTQMIAQGGWMMPLGQEDALRNQFAAYRQLPAQPFENVEPKSPQSKDSFVVIRKLTIGRRTYFYVVNNAPWDATADIELAMPRGGLIHQFGTLQPQRPRISNSGQLWSVELEPYDLIVGYFSDPTTEITDWHVRFDHAIKAELTTLVHEVKSRVNELRTREPLNVVPNAGFERTTPMGELADWEYSRGPGLFVETSTESPHRGAKSLHMKVTRPNGVAWIRNQQFEAPTTGRLSLLAWVRTKDEDKQPELRLAIDTGRGYYNFATLGKSADSGVKSEKLGTKWTEQPYLFHCDTLPADLGTVAIGFDLVGEGEVWIDDVEVYDLYFFDTELNELVKNVATADLQLDENRVADCERFLDSYWPRFVIEHVPPARLAQLPRGVRAGDSQTRRNADPMPSPSPPSVEEKPSGLKRFIPSVPFRWPFSNRN